MIACRAFGAALGWAALALPGVATLSLPAAAELPLVPERAVRFTVDEGTWMSADVSPDGATIVFDLLGDLYTVPVAGGDAVPVSRGLPFDSQPVFSPDGARIAFVSDRSGSENLWVADADGTDARRLSSDDIKVQYASPAWAADGSAVYVSRRTEADGIFDLWLHHLAGGDGVRLTEGSTGPGQRRDERVNSIGAAPTPDGRGLFFAQKTNEQWDFPGNPQWKIVRRDLDTGEKVPVIDGPASAMRPVVSPDGTALVYGSRHDAHAGLRIRDLATGADRWLAFPVEHDAQDGSYSRDLLPGYDFTPDGETLVASVGGQLHRIDVDGGKATPIPVTVDVDLEVGPYLPRTFEDETGPVRARIVHAPRQSPDGGRLAFSALRRLYVKALPDGAAELRVESAGGAFQPAWSPDGRWLAYVGWTPDGGHVYRLRADGRGRPRRVSAAAAFYTEPLFSPDGRFLYALRSSNHDRLERVEEVSPSRVADLVRFPVDGGAATLVAHAGQAPRRPHFTADPERIWLTTPAGVESLRTDGGDRRVHFRIEGAYRWNHRAEKPVPVRDAMVSPDGRFVLVHSGNQLHVLRVPPAGEATPVLNLLDSPKTPRERLTTIGADYFAWSADGGTITWALGSTFARRAFDGTEVAAHAETVDVDVALPRDVAEGSLLLSGATAITMAEQGVIEDADVLVTDSRIAAIGPRGSLDVPDDADVRDVGGRYLVPGFVDTHAHWYEVRRDVLDTQNWSFLASLAYGITAGVDPQAMDQDMFAYQDLVDAGEMIGPRAWSVGRGMFSDNRLENREDAVELLRRYRDHYRTRYVKSYVIGTREQRQWVVSAAQELGMMPTTEGMNDLKLDLTHAVDGFAGNEHYMPVFPLYRDVVELFGRTRIGYTPTVLITSGGPAASSGFLSRRDWHDDPKVRRFVPHAIVDKLTDTWTSVRPELQVYRRAATDARRIMAAGGRVGVGSHAVLQGVALHWEMQAYADGGWEPREILRAATAAGSEMIGRGDVIGTLEAGKYADLVILEDDPLEDIANTMSIAAVMKNGRLYDGDTLDERWPRQRPLPAQWYRREPPGSDARR